MKDKMLTLVNIHDLPSDTPGKTWKQKNTELKHNYPIGSLVEIIETGVRLFIVFHARDCDQTPLYCLSHNKNDTKRDSISFYNNTWINGHHEKSMILIK